MSLLFLLPPKEGPCGRSHGNGAPFAPNAAGPEASLSRSLRCRQGNFAAHRSLSSMHHHLVVRSGGCPQCTDEDRSWAWPRSRCHQMKPHPGPAPLRNPQTRLSSGHLLSPCRLLDTGSSARTTLPPTGPWGPPLSPPPRGSRTFSSLLRLMRKARYTRGSVCHFGKNHILWCDRDQHRLLPGP